MKKNKGKVCKEMPFCPTGKEFWPEYNVGVFAPKHTDCIFSGPRIKWKILSNEEEIL